MNQIIKRIDDLLYQFGEIYNKQFKTFAAKGNRTKALEYHGKYAAICLARTIVMDQEYGQLLLDVEKEGIACNPPEIAAVLDQMKGECVWAALKEGAV